MTWRVAVLMTMLDFYGDNCQITRVIGFLVDENLSVEPIIKSSTNIDRVMDISRISVHYGGHLGFTTKPPDESLHTLWKFCPETFVDSYQPLKKSATFPP